MKSNINFNVTIYTKLKPTTLLYYIIYNYYNIKCINHAYKYIHILK